MTCRTMSKKKMQIEGYEDKAKVGLIQSQEDYFLFHWISHVSFLYNPKDMFGIKEIISTGR